MKKRTGKILFNKIIPGLITGILLFTGANPVYSEPARCEKIFSQGVIQYKNALYTDALITFKSLISQPEPNPFITGGYYMAARCAWQIQKKDQAISYIKYLISSYPESRYVADGHYLWGCLELQSNKPADALEQFALAIEHSRSDSLLLKSYHKGEQLLQTDSRVQAYNLLLQSYPWSKAAHYIQLWQAESSIIAGNKKQGVAIINEILADKPSLQVSKLAAAIKTKQASPHVRIGIVLPVTGYFSAESKDMLRGMALALHQANAKDKIQVIIADSKGSLVGAIANTRALLKLNPGLIIGELEDNITSVIAGLTSREKMPLLAPVATENGINSIGDHIFQANNDLNTRGSQLAEYAYNTLNLKTFATIAPADEYGNTITDAFTKRVDQLGGTIIAQKWYYPGANDLQRQFEGLREAGFRYSFRDSLYRSNIKVTPARVDSMFRVVNYNVKENSADDEGLIESTEIQVTSIHGLFMPVYEEELSIIAPQLALANIKAQPLGGGFWLNEKLLQQQRNYINGIVFVAGYFFSETDPQYRAFVNQYREYTQASPGKMSVYGYNIMNLVIAAVNAGNNTSQSISNYLENVQNFEGIGGKVNFYNNNNINGAVNILQFLDGNIEKIN